MILVHHDVGALERGGLAVGIARVFDKVEAMGRVSHTPPLNVGSCLGILS